MLHSRATASVIETVEVSALDVAFVLVAVDVADNVSPRVLISAFRRLTESDTAMVCVIALGIPFILATESLTVTVEVRVSV